MLKLPQILMSRVLLFGLAAGAIVGAAAGFGALGMFYFDVTQTDRTTGSGTDGPVSWHLSRWSRKAVTPCHQLPDWVGHQPGSAPNENSPAGPPGLYCPTAVPPLPASCHGK